MASGLVEGSVSALNYSSEVANMVTQVVILSLTTILYPKMTELFARNNKAEKNSFTLTYINVVSLLVLPLAALIFAFSKEIVQILFGRGAFNENTVVFVSRALKIYALGIVGASFRDVLNKVFYSMKDTKTPYKVVENRKEAIAWAMNNAKPDDIILLAGKGHETYQILPTGTIHFDEREVIAEVLEESKK